MEATQNTKFEVFNTPTNYPIIYQIEMTESCNFNCPMCIGKRIKKPKSIKTDLIDKIVDSGYLKNTLYTELQFSGEPTLSANMEYAIDRIKSTGTLVGFSTNMSTQGDTYYLFDKVDCVTLSVDVFHKEAYEKSRYPAKFEDMKDNLHDIIKDTDSSVRLQVQLLKTEWTKDVYEESKEALYDFLDKCQQSDNVIVREIEDCFIGYHGEGKMQYSEEMCLNPFLTVSIKADGTVVPCCFDFLKDLPLGNLYDDSLLDIWQKSQMIEKLRKSHRSKQSLPKKCSNCYARSPIIFMNNEIVPDLVKFKMENT